MRCLDEIMKDYESESDWSGLVDWMVELYITHV